MQQSLCILGRQPALGLAELESLYGSEVIRPVGTQVAILNKDPGDVNYYQLGGSVRLCMVLDTFIGVRWSEVESFILAKVPDRLQQETGGKLRLGLSVIGLDVTAPQLMATNLKLKKVIQSLGHSVRIVPNKTKLLNTAQVMHNRLAKPGGCELFLVRDGDQTILARTTDVQDINDYTTRDRYRPKRDARVGMLPPKLAQIIINLAGQHVAPTPPNSYTNSNRPTISARLLDPFCGTGVVLQEALLMGYKVFGSDIEPRMITYSLANLEWLKEKYDLPNADYALKSADATTCHWDQDFGLIASETYLGRPFTNLPSLDVLAQTISDCNLIIKKFLQNIGQQIPSGTRLCLAVPAWQTAPDKFKHLPLIDQLNDLGYNHISFKYVRHDQLLYYRENQIVGRELLVLTRK
jgi:hypothetical protein